MKQLTTDDIESEITDLEYEIVDEVDRLAYAGELPPLIIRKCGRRDALLDLLAELEEDGISKEGIEDGAKSTPTIPKEVKFLGLPQDRRYPPTYNLNGVSDEVVSPPPTPHRQSTPTDTTGVWRPFGEVEMLHSQKYGYVSVRNAANHSKSMRFDSWGVVQQIYRELPDESGTKEVQTAMRSVVPDKKHDKMSVYLLMRLFSAHPSFQCELKRSRGTGAPYTLVKHDGKETAHVDTGDNTTLDKSEVLQ
ncbi:MAG: hypothetical protein ACXQS4_02530 [Methermicoccaceae archaeon]